MNLHLQIPTRAALLLALVTLLPACASLHPDADLQRIYDICATDDCAEPVVLVHGAFGSRLRSANGGHLWPRGIVDLMLGNYDDIGLGIDPRQLMPIQDGSEAYRLFDRAGETDFYARILNTLEHSGRFHRGQIGTPQRRGDRVYYVFLYDWRRDLVEAAAQLNEFIERIRSDYGDPELRVNLVAHSAGAVLARYYLRYGGKDVLDHPPYRPTLDGARNLRNLVMVGAPNRGTMSGLDILVRGYRVGLGTIPPEVLATMPAGYQMLPEPGQQWVVNSAGESLVRDLYQPALWREQQWSVYDPEARKRVRQQYESDDAAARQLDLLERFHARQLERSRQLHAALSTPLPATDVRFIVIGGDCVATSRRMLAEQQGGRERLRLRPQAVTSSVPAGRLDQLMLGAGDGRITKLSALGILESQHTTGKAVPAPFPVDYALFLCESHSQLTGNLHFQTNLLNILLRQPPFTGVPRRLKQ